MKRKLERFRIIEERANVVEPSKPVYQAIKGRWNSEFFRNENPISVELACGRGEYTVGLASRFPTRNFIGVDIKGERLWKGSTVAADLGLTNAAFLRTQILLIENFFVDNEIDEIWLIFPDPRPRKRDTKRRLTSPRFLEIYKRILRPGGYLRIKTDSSTLYDYTLDQLQARGGISDLQFTDNLYHSELRSECFDIRTRYEEAFSAMGEQIKYIRFRFQE